MRDLVFVGLCHKLSCCCIGQLYTIRSLLSDILDVVPKRLLLQSTSPKLERFDFDKKKLQE